MNLDELENVTGGRDLVSNGDVLCIKCYKTFNKYATLVTRSLDCNEETYIKCPNCKKRFYLELNYFTHSEGCDEERYKKCLYCEYEFK